MPIGIKEFYATKERKIKTDKELLDYMQTDKEYSSADIRRFLGINKNAVLHRLKKLEGLGFVQSRVNDRLYIWKKIKDYEDTDRHI